MSSPPSATWSVVACADSTRTRSTSRSPASSATTSKSTSSSRCSLEAQLQHGALHEWYGERVTSTLFKGVVPDGYGVINLPHRPPVHLLLELDRATEPARQLHDKAVLYARQIPRSQLDERDAFVVLTAPTATRAKLAREAVAGTGAPIVVAEWSKASTHSPLAIVTDAADRIAAQRLAPVSDP